MRAVAKDAGEAMGGGHESEAVREQQLLVRGEEGRPREHRQVHRRNVMAESRQGQLSRLHRAARLVVPSTTATDQPLVARCTAAARPLCPAPMTTAS